MKPPIIMFSLLIAKKLANEQFAISNEGIIKFGSSKTGSN